MTYKDFQGDSFVPPTDHHKTYPFLFYDFEPYKGGAIEMKELPFVIGVVADLSGRPQEPLPLLRDRRFVLIDRDNFNDVLKGMKPRLAFKVDNKLTADESSMGVELRFNEMEDFEPKQLVNQVP